MTHKIDNKDTNMNIYAENMHYIQPENKKHLSILTDFILEDEWINVGKTPFNKQYFAKFAELNKIKVNDYHKYMNLKPYGVWFSKGGWIFHEDMCCNMDNYITIAKVDYSNIYRITGKDRFNNPMDNSKYKSSIRKFDKEYNGSIIMKGCNPNYNISISRKISVTNETRKTRKNNSIKNEKNENAKNAKKPIKCKTIKTQRKCAKYSRNCTWFDGFNAYNWGKLYKNYDGFALYPYMDKDFMRKVQKHLTFTSWDVESLVLWSSSPIIKYKTLGTIRQIIDDNKIDKDSPQFYSKLVGKLIEKITEWRRG